MEEIRYKTCALATVDLNIVQSQFLNIINAL